MPEAASTRAGAVPGLPFKRWSRSLALPFLLPCFAACDPAGDLVGAQERTKVITSIAGDREALFGDDWRETPFVQAQRRRRTPAVPAIMAEFEYPTRTGKEILVRAGDNLQRALDEARRGDEIVLEAGQTFTGNFILRSKPGTSSDGWIVIRSDRSTGLPAIGNRVGPEHVPLMATVETPNQSAAIATEPGASGWRLVGFEVTAAASMTALNYALVSLGATGTAQNTLTDVPTDLVLDRMYVHGQTTTNTMRCIALNSARTAITDSYIAECHAKGLDSQAILGWNGPGPFKIVNNMLAGAGENVMFGGGDPSIAGLVPSDIEIRRNYIYKPLSWKGVWTVKNLLETKNAARVLVEGNVLDGSWVDAQGGMAILLRSTNQGGGCRWCRTTDVTIRRNLIRNSGGGIAFIGGDVHPVDTAARRILMTENVMDGLNTEPYTGARPRAFMFVGPQRPHDITVERTVAVGNLYQGMWVDRDNPSTGVVLRDVVLTRGEYGIGADGFGEGASGLNAGLPGLVWSNVTIIGTTSQLYPPGTGFALNEASIPLSKTIRDAVAQATAGVAR